MRQSVRAVGFVVILLLSAIALASAQTGELAIAVATDPLTLDPKGASNVISWSLAYHIADPLVGKDRDLKIVPLLAESWDRPDPLTWRFKLRRGAKFQNGEDVTAAAVKATLDVMIDPELAKTKKIQVSAFIRGNFRTVERVEAPDPYTVIIKTKAPYRPMLLGLSQLGIAPVSALDAGEAYVAHPVGAGPYKFVEYRPGIAARSRGESHLLGRQAGLQRRHCGSSPRTPPGSPRCRPRSARHLQRSPRLDRPPERQTRTWWSRTRSPPATTICISRTTGRRSTTSGCAWRSTTPSTRIRSRAVIFQGASRARLGPDGAGHRALRQEPEPLSVRRGQGQGLADRGRIPATGSSSSWARRSAASSTIGRSHRRRWWGSSPRPRLHGGPPGGGVGSSLANLSGPHMYDAMLGAIGGSPTPTPCSWLLHRQEQRGGVQQA